MSMVLLEKNFPITYGKEKGFILHKEGGGGAFSSDHNEDCIT